MAASWTSVSASARAVATRKLKAIWFLATEMAEHIVVDDNAPSSGIPFLMACRVAALLLEKAARKCDSSQIRNAEQTAQVSFYFPGLSL